MTQSKQSIAVAVDLIIFTVRDSALQAILIKMKKEPFVGKWAFPGGRIKQNESLDDAARRELVEKTGVKNVYLEQLYTFGDPRRDPFGHVISVAYFALINSEDVHLSTTSKYADIGWFNMRKLPKLAYDHSKVARYSLQRLQWKLGYTNVAYSLLPRFFTLSELQGVYEIIWGKKLDKRNFQKKMRALGILKKTSVTQAGRHRPAVLHTFRTHKPEIISMS